jgi:hypothetical protein
MYKEKLSLIEDAFVDLEHDRLNYQEFNEPRNQPGSQPREAPVGIEQD